MAALGPRSLRLAGQHFDGVILPAFLTPHAVEQMTGVVRDAAAAARRDPCDVRVYATVITITSPTPGDLDILAGRAVTYLQPPVHGERLLHLNRWDLAPLTRLRAHPLIAGLGAALADQAYSPKDLTQVGQLLPQHWITNSTAAGSPSFCAERLSEYLEAGADELILHGTPPDRLEPAVTAYRRWTTDHAPLRQSPLAQ
jgi:alkanesulfonate monooxygenase SsuD/methylene tetrahydromethanopterin reductase-like flavin-dependent oxidoreductase (luciferase family)